ncbi:hypothetical protein G6F59_018556 [Rhizopus arrhizus]|nr:hypothetical protein G6F59_018556 [Rhizopus arrhizus]
MVWRLCAGRRHQPGGVAVLGGDAAEEGGCARGPVLNPVLSPAPVGAGMPISGVPACGRWPRPEKRTPQRLGRAGGAGRCRSCPRRWRDARPARRPCRPGTPLLRYRA